MLSKQTQKFVWALILPVIANLGLNILLIPLYGLMGAVWATIFSYMLAIVIATILGRREYPLPIPFKAAFEISFCSALMALVVMNLPLGGMAPGFITLVIKGTVGIMVYFLACWVINAADCRTFIRGLKTRVVSKTMPEPAE